MKTNYLVGIKAAGPIMIGYLPVSVVFGVAGVAAGFLPWQIIMMSCLIFAGASQFILLASFTAGTPWLWVVGLCGLMNARHLLYGPLLSALLPTALRMRLVFAFALTDEVFATALSQLKTVDERQRSTWLACGGLRHQIYFQFCAIVPVQVKLTILAQFQRAALKIIPILVRKRPKPVLQSDQRTGGSG